MIKLKCSNEDCYYQYEISEKELKDNAIYYMNCVVCGGKIEVENIDEIVSEDLKNQVKNNINKWFKGLGVEYTLEFIKRNQEITPEKVYQLYQEEIEQRGLKL